MEFTKILHDVHPLNTFQQAWKKAIEKSFASSFKKKFKEKRLLKKYGISL
jgi:hypothetical protein